MGGIPEVANVTNAKGRHLGVLQMGDIISAMVPPRVEAEEAVDKAA